MAEIILKQIAKDLEFVKERVIDIESELADLSSELHEIKPEYIEKIQKIEKGKGIVFHKKEDFLNFLKDEI